MRTLILLSLFILTSIFHTAASDEMPFLPDLAVITPDNAAELTPLATLGCGHVSGIDWTPDGRKLYMAAAGGLYIYNMDDLSAAPKIIPVKFNSPIEFEHTGQYLLTRKEIWDVSDWSRPAITFSGAYEMKLSLDGTLIVYSTVNDQRVIELWEMGTWKKVLTLPSTARAASVSNDGSLLAYADGLLSDFYLLDRRSGIQVGPFSAMHGAHELQFSPDGIHLAVRNDSEYSDFGYWEAFTGVWNVGDLLNQPHPEPHLKVVFSSESGYDRGIQALEFLPETSYFLIMGGNNDRTTLWDMETGEQIRTFMPMEYYRISDNGDYISLGVSDGGGTWKVKTGEKLFDRVGYFSPDSQTYIQIEQYPKLYRIADQQVIHEFPCHLERYWKSVAFSDDGRDIAVVGNLSAGLWHLDTTPPGFTPLIFHASAFYMDVEQLGFSADNRWVITRGSGSPTPQNVTTWDAETGVESTEIALQTVGTDVLSVVSPEYKLYSPDKRLTVSRMKASDDSEDVMQVWDDPSLHGGQSKLLLTVPLQPGMGIPVNFAFDSASRLIAAAVLERGYKSTLYVWSVEQLRNNITEPLLAVPLDAITEAVAFNNDGTLLAVAGRDALLHLWGISVDSAN